MNITHFQITQMPQVATSRARELQWCMSFWSQRYGEISVKKSEAWKLYNAAIDNLEPAETVREIGRLAEMLEIEAVNAWKLWNDAKRDYLALEN